MAIAGRKVPPQVAREQLLRQHARRPTRPAAQIPLQSPAVTAAADARVHGPELVVDVILAGLADDDLEGVNDCLRLHKHGAMQGPAAAARALGIVQHGPDPVQEAERREHLVPVHPDLGRRRFQRVQRHKRLAAHGPQLRRGLVCHVLGHGLLPLCAAILVLVPQCR